ncbi:IS5 family transposase [Streptomyces prasinus]|uniref:IS5 family transposase n=1 Tax=Streptomyces prasinus TaxID=67345 RepID=UPI001FCC2797|nr:IS5 family transposase [Streptomyces prasinus]
MPKLVAEWPRVPDRQALRGILFVLHTGIQREYLPQELGFGSGVTCWSRLAAWNEAGVWDRLHIVLLTKLRAAKQFDWFRAVIDSSHVRAARRGPKAAPARSTAHVRAASTTSSSTAAAPRPRSSPPRPTSTTSPRPLPRSTASRPPAAPAAPAGALLGDRGYDHDKYRRLVWAQGVKPVIARRGVPHGSGLGVHRWVVERTIAWLHGFRRLRVRWERRDDIHEAFLGLATCLITHRHVQRLC